MNTNASVQCEEISYREREQPSLPCGEPGAQCTSGKAASGLDFYGELTLSWQQITSKKAFFALDLEAWKLWSKLQHLEVLMQGGLNSPCYS